MYLQISAVAYAIYLGPISKRCKAEGTTYNV